MVNSEEVEYPIELTCEVGPKIYFVYIKNNDSWIETRNALGNLKKNQNKRFAAKVEFQNETIFVSAKKMHGFESLNIAINRFTP